MTDENRGERGRLGRDNSPREARETRETDNAGDYRPTETPAGTPTGSSSDTNPSSGRTGQNDYDSTSGTSGTSNSSGGQEKGSIDKLIDKAQEKGIFEKAEKLFRDKFGGGSGGSNRRR